MQNSIRLTGLNACVNILCLGLNDLYERFGFSVLGFTLDCTKNKELKWSENILPKTKKRQQKEKIREKRKYGSEKKLKRAEKRPFQKNKKTSSSPKEQSSYKVPTSNTFIILYPQGNV